MARNATNKDLHSAKKSKNDEFYTQLVDIEKELKSYKEHFRDKVIFCNCDDPEESNFWKYFSLNFEYLGLKKLLATHYEDKKQSYMLEMWKDERGVHTDIRTLKQNGDFRSPECVELLKQADIVVTNPPFSLFREYVAQLIEYDKKFLIIGNINCLTYKEIFILIKNGKAWLGTGMGRWISGFIVPEEYELYGTEARINENGQRIVSTNNCLWLTNLDHKKRHEDLLLYKNYSEEEFQKFDNYNAINVNKTADIPCDYADVMGVPITFMDKFNPDQFEIVGQLASSNANYFQFGAPYVNGKKVYARILIKRKEKG